VIPFHRNGKNFAPDSDRRMLQMKAWGGHIHLRTVVVFGITALVLVWMNALIRHPEVLRLFQNSVLYGYGWPVFSIEGYPRSYSAGNGVGIYFVEQWKFAGFAINFITAVLILSTVTAFSEFAARAENSRK
jgi:hypothetical protein